MTFISNDPSFWPQITASQAYSYYIVASCAAVVYDWGLKFAQEFDLIWRQRWSSMTFLYVGVRYSGLLYCGISILTFCNYVSLYETDFDCSLYSNLGTWIPLVVNAMVGAITITRLYAMYQQSRIIIILLVFMWSAITVSCVVIAVIQSRTYQFEGLILSGQYFCGVVVYDALLTALTWILGTVWEVLTLYLAVRIAIKHFRELPTGWTIEDCFRVLIRSHVLYFASFAAVACLNLGELSPITNTISMGARVYNGILEIFVMVQMFVLAPRLILSIRQYNAEAVAESDEATAMTSIAFQARTQTSHAGDA